MHFGSCIYQIQNYRLKSVLESQNYIGDFSTLERFIDFFRYILTGNSVLSDFKEIYTLLYIKEHDGVAWPGNTPKFDGDQTNWAPIIGFVKLIDASRDSVISKYSIDTCRLDDDITKVKMCYEGILISEVDCAAHAIRFLKKHLLSDFGNGINFFSPEGRGLYSTFSSTMREYFSTTQESMVHENDVTDHQTLNINTT